MPVEDLTPAEFREQVRSGLHGEFTPAEFQVLKRMYAVDGTDALKSAARDQLPDDLEDREAYVDAMAEAFEAEVGGA